MQIKRFFFALPMALMAVFFAFCAKEQQQTPVKEVLNTDGVVGERACCQITVTVNNTGPVVLCGVQTSFAACGVFGATVLRGTDNWFGQGARTYNLCFPNDIAGTAFTVSGLPTHTATSVTVTSANGSSVGPFAVGAGLPARTIVVGSDCTVF